MKIELQSGDLRLAQGQLIRVRDAQGHTVLAREGAVWITEENSPRDVVLRPNERFRLTRPGLAIVHAFGDASIAFG